MNRYRPPTIDNVNDRTGGDGVAETSDDIAVSIDSVVRLFDEIWDITRATARDSAFH